MIRAHNNTSLNMRILFLILISVFFISAGIYHFINPGFFTNIMPSYIGYHWELVIISGVFEVLGGIGLLVPKTRRFAAYGLIALCIAVLPANINMLVNSDLYPSVPLIGLIIRIPLQFVLIWLIWWSSSPKKQGSVQND